MKVKFGELEINTKLRYTVKKESILYLGAKKDIHAEYIKTRNEGFAAAICTKSSDNTVIAVGSHVHFGYDTIVEPITYITMVI